MFNNKFRFLMFFFFWQGWVLTFFLCLNKILLHKCQLKKIHSAVDGHLRWFYVLAVGPFPFFFFEARSHVAQAGLQFELVMEMILNFLNLCAGCVQFYVNLTQAEAI